MLALGNNVHICARPMRRDALKMAFRNGPSMGTGRDGRPSRQGGANPGGEIAEWRERSAEPVDCGL